MYMTPSPRWHRLYSYRTWRMGDWISQDQIYFIRGLNSMLYQGVQHPQILLNSTIIATDSKLGLLTGQ